MANLPEEYGLLLRVYLVVPFILRHIYQNTLQSTINYQFLHLFLVQRHQIQI